MSTDTEDITNVVFDTLDSHCSLPVFNTDQGIIVIGEADADDVRFMFQLSITDINKVSE